MKKKDTKKYIGITLTAIEKKKLGQIASEDCRTTTGYLRKIVKAYLEEKYEKG